jgi:hypothetical protein
VCIVISFIRVFCLQVYGLSQGLRNQCFFCAWCNNYCQRPMYVNPTIETGVFVFTMEMWLMPNTVCVHHGNVTHAKHYVSACDKPRHVFTPTLMRNVCRETQGVALWRCVCRLIFAALCDQKVVGSHRLSNTIAVYVPEECIRRCE